MLLSFLQCIGQPSTRENGPAPIVSSVEGEKPWQGGSGAVFQEPYFVLDILFNHLSSAKLRE